VYDNEGKKIAVTENQIKLLELLANQQDIDDITREQYQLMDSVSYKDLETLDPNLINDILDGRTSLNIPHLSKPLDRTGKKIYSYNDHCNSEDYKNLGTLHKDRRVQNYYDASKLGYQPKSL
jgi:hypothetical protein